MLADSGVDVVAVLPFTRDFAASSPEEFLVQTFDGTVPSFLHVGYDFKFGARAAGTVRDLDSWAAVGGTSVQEERRRRAHYGHAHPPAVGRRGR